MPETYAAKFLISKMNGKASVSKVMAALAKEEDREEIIEELENIIRDMRKENTEDKTQKE